MVRKNPFWLSGLFKGSLFIGLVLCLGLANADTGEREQAAAKVTKTFLQELSEGMTREMGKGGPVEAIKVCAELAQEIANRLSRENGWRVTRVGTRVRNPLLGMPDIWEQTVLEEFAARAGKGESLSGMSHGEIVTEPGGKYFRFMQAIPVQPKCLLCHGPAETIPETIQAILKKHYPFDAAIGYIAGDLRGAVSIKQPLGEPNY
ncbi:MAG: DUF3365 domain-containing protein [Nitrospirales bacterium]